eukprot:TRINITY_DN7391_c0_g1_i10.p1 TRINITY_DN7391_c0_g1~~TRINITY_DN7391_c0_g1_i10.p1  ORF type:complete len:462 (-),score=36.78 TRINITY_DN7391_c0_g1_i10:305-1690(-)
MQQCICMVSDFFYPSMGGVESHIWQLSQCLMSRGHKVIVVTHFYDDRIGIRYMTNFLKVYYLPILPFYNKSILPTIVGSLPYLRHIFITEKVTIVHGHSAFSSLAHEALFIASLLDIPSVFTDHSLFGFSDASAIVTNEFLKYSLVNTSHTICVSHTGKENTVLRSGVKAEKVSVIPNAIDSVRFSPQTQIDTSQTEIELCDSSETNYHHRDEDTDYHLNFMKKRRVRSVTIVVGSRLVYRKGIDLLAIILPIICTKPCKIGNTWIQIDFIIAGDGPKRILLEEVIEKHNLQQRVEMLGELQHSDIRDKLLIKGDIFLNTSLTEAFCMAIVEAVSCGLTVVSTNVGGISEVLPAKFIFLVEPNVDAILDGIYKAVEGVVTGTRASAEECNQFVRQAYNWTQVAARTEKVYSAITQTKIPPLQKKVRNLWECGRIAGPIMGVLYLACHYWCIFLALWSHYVT